MTIQDLKPNSQDTSAFYLRNIYGVLADPNVTPPSITSPVAQPPPFSPPTSAIWVNSLWFLSFVLSVICALLATSLQQWARRYIRVTQPARCSPEKRARMRAFFANGVDKFGARLVVERLPMLLHLSLFLFFVGLAIFLFNVNHAVFGSVVWLIVSFSTVYGLITLMPVFWHNSPYFTPLSGLVFRVVHLELAVSTVFFVVWVFRDLKTWEHLQRWLRRRRRWAFGGVEKEAEEEVSERSWEVDVRILGWSIGALGDDDALEKFFDAIPGFFNSKLVKPRDFPKYLLNWFWNALNGFLCRTLSSNLVSESIKSHRVDIGMYAMSLIGSPRTSSTSSFPYDILVEPGRWDQVSQIPELGPDRILTYCTSDHKHTAHYAQCIVAKILASVPERDDHWIQFATRALGLSELDLRNYISHGNDNVVLAISIHLIRQSIQYRFYDWDALKAFSKLDIVKTVPELQHGFCVLWNEVVLEARKQEQGLHSNHSPLVVILRWSRRQYIALHRDADASEIDFPRDPSLFPLCDIPHHLHGHGSVPESTTPVPPQPGVSPAGSPRQPTLGGNTVPQQAEGVNVTTESPLPFDQTTTKEFREMAEAFTAAPPTLSSNSGPRVTLAPPPAPGVPSDGHDRNQAIPVEIFRHQAQSLRQVPSPPGSSTNSLKREDHQHSPN